MDTDWADLRRFFYKLSVKIRVHPRPIHHFKLNELINRPLISARTKLISAA
jgi:hypothetical protein